MKKLNKSSLPAILALGICLAFAFPVLAAEVGYPPLRRVQGLRFPAALLPGADDGAIRDQRLVAGVGRSHRPHRRLPILDLALPRRAGAGVAGRSSL